MLSRTIGALNLGPTGNIQGIHKFLSLKTGEVIVWRKWTELPVPQDVIDCLREISGEHGKLIIDEEEEEVNIGVDKIYDETVEESLGNEQIMIEDENEALGNEDAEEDVRKASVLEGETRENEADGGDAIIDHTMEEIDVSDKEVSHSYNLRPSRDRNYSHKFSFVSVKVGLQRWGERAVDALNNELNLFIKENVFEKVENSSKSR